jgi:hypothetical protein
MLLTPIFCSAILARQWRWVEVVTLVAAIAALSAKDPMVVLARQWFVWRQRHPETAVAAKYLAGWTAVLILCGVVFINTWPLATVMAFGVGVFGFSVLAVLVNVRNRQRSTAFQIVSAVALTSGSLATCLSATGSIAPWCWWLWSLMAMQSAAGILVVHARLDARIATRRTTLTDQRYRHAAMGILGVLAGAAVAAIIVNRGWVGLALAVIIVGYLYDLSHQSDPAEIKVPLTRVGQRALALSSLYSILLILGLW